MNQINISADVAKEIFEISSDFANPVEVLREAVHNSYDAGSKKVTITAEPTSLADGSRALTIQIADDGHGMNREALEHFFGLGFSDKPPSSDRRTIGFKGHGTKIYYQAKELWVATKTDDLELHLAVLTEARRQVFQKQLPKPELYEAEEAKTRSRQAGLWDDASHGTVIRLIDFTPNSSNLIDSFHRRNLENYLRWFTVFGSFERIVKQSSGDPPMFLELQGADENVPRAVAFGHDWPIEDRTNLKNLKKLDDRRPFNYFRKSFYDTDRTIEGGYKIDIAAVFEGRRGRLERDPCVSRQRAGGLNTEEERYGLWLCRDYIPVEKKFEWLLDDDCPTIADDLRRPLIFVNCQEFYLTANRGSVGNSSPKLLEAVQQGVYEFLGELLEDRDLERFFNEYQEELYSRRREKDRRALQRRIERYNSKKYFEITLSNGRKHQFWEPRREITLFGLVAELQVLDPTILELELLDYDDHSGIDMLVRRGGTPSDLLEKNKVAYTELKYELSAHLNHAFDNLQSIICWDTRLNHKDPVHDPANNVFYVDEHANGVTYTRLTPPANGKLSHNIQVVVLRRLLEEKHGLKVIQNPNPIGR